MNDKPFTHIDLGRLEEEWAKQHELAYKYHMLLTEAQEELADAEDQLELMEAKLDKVIRSNPDTFGILKVSEPAIKHAIVCHPDYRKVKREVNNCIYKVNKCKAATISLEHKKKGLEGAVSLWIGKYFDKPKVSNDFKERAEEEQKRIVRRRARDG